jgi:hypothetical protein
LGELKRIREALEKMAARLTIGNNVSSSAR